MLFFLILLCIARSDTSDMSQKGSPIIARSNNYFLLPHHTSFHKHLTKHINDIEEVRKSKMIEKDKEDKNCELILSKLCIFLGGLIDKIFKDYHKKLGVADKDIDRLIQETDNKIIEIRYKCDEIIKSKDSSKNKIKNAFQIICTLWVEEKLLIYKICNSTILADFYYSILGQYVNVTKLIPIKEAPINIEFDGFDEKIELISHYCSLLCVMCLFTTKSREDSRILYRAVSFVTDRKYKLGEDYRFITFQSCDGEFKNTLEYLNQDENSLYTMTLTKDCNNGVHIQNNNEEKENLIMPFSSFSMDSNILTFL